MKEWLRPDEGGPRLRFLRRAAPNLWRCLQKIQKDEQRPDVYAKEPHALTHDVDSLCYFCVWWAAGPPAGRAAPRAHWEADIWEDYEHAGEPGQGVSGGEIRQPVLRRRGLRHQAENFLPEKSPNGRFFELQGRRREGESGRRKP